MIKRVLIFLLVVVVILSIFITKSFTGRAITIIPGGDEGITVFPGASPGLTSPRPIPAPVPLTPPPPQENTAEVTYSRADCWKCPLDDFVYNTQETGILWENVTNEYIVSVTNCTNKSMFVSIECPPTAEINNLSLCGNGVCGEGENITSCPQDCVQAENFSVTYDNSSEIQEEENTSEETSESETPSESPPFSYSGDSYQICTDENPPRCATMLGVPPGGWKNYIVPCCCRESCTEEESEENAPQLSAIENPIVLKFLIQKLFGINF